MASETISQTQPIKFERKPSPVSFFHMPMSPSEPGKFDFYRVYLINHGYTADSMFSDNLDAIFIEQWIDSVLLLNSQNRILSMDDPIEFLIVLNDIRPTLTTSPANSSKQCWMSSGDLLSSSQSKPFPLSNIDSRSFQDSSVSSNTNSKSCGFESNVVSSSTLTNTVKKAMNKGQLSTINSNPTKSVYHGTTLSTKDLNHLSPQSM